MSAPELTPWFPAGVEPARKGLYETRAEAPEVRPAYSQYQRWDGVHWRAWSSDLETAAELRRSYSSRQQPEWRGLAKKPARAVNARRELREATR